MPRVGDSIWKGDLKLKPFFTYFGGKYRIAPKYPRPRYGLLIEPFAGSAGYSVRYYNREVRLYDVNPQVFGTWDYLIKTPASEIRRLPLEIEDVRSLSIPQEAKWVIGWWLNKGHTQPCNVPGFWMREGTRPNSVWGATVRERIASQVGCIRHWKIFNCCFTEIRENSAATWFIDPPYQDSGRCYPFNEVDYPQLASWTSSRAGQVVACGQEGDDWLPFRPFVETRGTGGYKMPGTSKEVIWTNDSIT